MTRILLHLHNALFLKILLFGEDWGGPECAAYIPISTHIKESSAWVVILLAIGFQFNFQRTIRQFYDKTSTFLALRAKIPPLQRVFEIMIASLYFIMFGVLFIVKLWTQALVHMLQPCHLFLVIQGYAILSQTATGALLTLLMLPPQTGALFAIAMPAINGVTVVEVYIFWIQHILLALMPIYLLIRNDFVATRFCSFTLLFIGIWTFAMTHFTLYEIIGVSFQVNPDFIICPTYGMRELFANFPPYLLYPSYRTFTTIVFATLAIVQSYVYYWIARTVLYL